jgi:transcriptional regulator NrdR family protein
VKLRDPEQCPSCKCRRYRVIDSRRRGSERIGYYRRRVHRCRECGHKWQAFLNTINPKHVNAA